MLVARVCVHVHKLATGSRRGTASTADALWLLRPDYSGGGGSGEQTGASICLVWLTERHTANGDGSPRDIWSGSLRSHRDPDTQRDVDLLTESTPFISQSLMHKLK